MTNDQDYALVVGINDYPRYKSLNGAIEDAHEIKRWLLNEPIGGALPAANLRMVTSIANPPPARPIQQEIDEELQAIFDEARQKGGRRLYFYFSGHGFASKPSDVALCLASWSKTFRNLAISSLQYRDAIAEHGIFSEIVVLLDCCRTREVAAVGFPPTNPRPAAAQQAGQARFFIAHATELFQQSMEASVPGGNGEPPLVRGHFTRALLAALWGGAAEKTGGVTPSALKSYVERETPLIAGEAGHSQKPVVSNELDDTVRLGSAVPKLDVEIRLKPEHVGDIRLEGPTLNVVHVGPASSSPWELTLEGGRHTLMHVDSGVSKAIPFRPSHERQRVEF